jgi:hypothetical protein
LRGEKNAGSRPGRDSQGLDEVEHAAGELLTVHVKCRHTAHLLHRPADWVLGNRVISYRFAALSDIICAACTCFGSSTATINTAASTSGSDKVASKPFS